MGKIDIEQLNDIANHLRIDSIRMTCAAKSGHPTSSCSAAEIVATLFFNEMKFDKAFPKNPSADRFVLSKGHACPVLYAAWHQAGHISTADMMNIRKITCDLEGHPTPRLDFIDVATGSLGQGLSCAAGMAYAGKYIDKASYRVYCLLGDGECAEAFASYYKLDNLVAIVDMNRLGQTQQTMLGHDADTMAKRFESFGCHAIIVDGSNVVDLLNAYDIARQTKGKPTVIVAKTLKGRGIVGIEDEGNWHGKPVPENTIEAIEQRLMNKEDIAGTLQIKQPVNDAPCVRLPLGCIKMAPPEYKIGDKVATRQAYGIALAKLGDACPRIIGLDGDTKNSTFSENLLKKHPEQFVECFIAEQNLVGVAVGLQCRDRAIPFASTFAAFFTRAADQLRMAAVSFANIKCAGSHVGVSIGEDGPSQMGLEDIALFRTIPGSIVFYPSDAVAAERATELAANTRGIAFIRTGRPACPVIYSNDEKFEIGKGKIIRDGSEPKMLIIGAGITLYEAIKAADKLQSENVEVIVMDPFTIKPLDKDLIIKSARRAENRIITVEDHYQAGGIGEAVCQAVSDQKDIHVRSLFVLDIPHSGPPDALLEKYGISAKCIVDAVHQFIHPPN
ncbi:Transketolase [Dirofilaria immitis]